MDHKVKPRQIDAARGHVSGDTDAGATVTQGLQRVGAFLLAEFARERHDLKAAIRHAGQKVVHVHPRLAEHDGRARFVIAQHVEDGVFAITGGDVQGAIFDIDMLAGLARCLNPQRIALKILGEGGDGGGNGGRKHHGATIIGCGGQDKFQILAEAEIEHLIGLVQHGGAQAGQIERAAFDMVAQAARRADHDMHAAFQRALFGAVIHAADAGGNLGPGFGIEPFKFTRDLQGQFARGGDDQGHRHIGEQQAVGPPQQVGGNGHAKGHGLARAGLGADKRVAASHFGLQHRKLDGGEGFVTAGGKRRCQRCGNRIVHFGSYLEGGRSQSAH